MIKRVTRVVLGITIIGVGIALMLNANLGIDPFSSFVQGVSVKLNIRFWYVQMAMLGSLIVGVYWGNKHYIGFGTLVNIVFIGYVIDTFEVIFSNLIQVDNFFINLVLVMIGILMIGIGAALYMNADLGLSTYDALGIIIEEKTKLAFKYNRILTDLACVILGYVLGATIGIGTIIFALLAGPMVSYFRKILP